MSDGESPLEPERPIIDPHVHLWEILPAPGLPQAPQRFLFDECRAMLDQCGHNVTHTVYVETHMMHRQDGPAELAPVGETEFANGMAAMSASGRYGPRRIAHRIVSTADLRLGDRVEPVLDAHQAAAGERFRGIRMATAWSETGLFGFLPDPAGRHIVRDPAFVAGAKVLARRGLSLDIWCVHSQLDEVIALADAVPDLTIVLDHCGTPDSGRRWAEPGDAAFGAWQNALQVLAERPNVFIKLGGMGMRLDRSLGAEVEETPSAVLAKRWRPLVETAIAAFGVQRAMFESNFPPDRDTATYVATWNAFKRIAATASEAEKDALFRGTAATVYHIT